MLYHGEEIIVVSWCVVGNGNGDVLIIHGIQDVAIGDGFVYRITGHDTFVARVGQQALLKTVTKQSVIPRVTLVEEDVQLLTRAPVLIHMKVKYAMEFQHVHT